MEIIHKIFEASSLVAFIAMGVHILLTDIKTKCDEHKECSNCRAVLLSNLSRYWIFGISSIIAAAAASAIVFGKLFTLLYPPL